MGEDTVTEFLMVRHGEPDYLAVKEWAEIYVASNFAPLTEKGVKQVMDVASLLKQEHADIIISSPYTRVLQGAAILSKELDIPLRVEPMLCEWQLDTSQSIKNDFRFKMLLKDFNRNDGHNPIGKKKRWESKGFVKDRVTEVFKKYKQYDKVIVSGHAVMIGYVTDDFRTYEYCEIKRFTY